MEHLGRQHCPRQLDNHEAIFGYWADLADWVSQDWYPRAQHAGLRNYAVVCSSNFLARHSTEGALLGSTGGIVAGFDDVATTRWALPGSQVRGFSRFQTA